MTFGGVRTFISGKLTELGFKEWTDGFNVENIPSNVLNKTFHVEHGLFSGSVIGQQLHEFRGPLTVRVFFRGYRNPQQAKDTALDAACEVLNVLLKPSVRISDHMNLKDVRPVSVRPLPIAASNDNSVILELVFEIVLHYRFS